MFAFTADQRGVVLAHGLNPDIEVRHIFVESSGNPSASRYEPHYAYLWDLVLKKPFRRLTTAEAASAAPPVDFFGYEQNPSREWTAQRTSWGLLQIMGAVARQYGYPNSDLTALGREPLVALDYACRHMRAQLDWAKGDYPQALAAFNGGHAGNDKPPFRNQGYANKVLEVTA